MSRVYLRLFTTVKPLTKDQRANDISVLSLSLITSGDYRIDDVVIGSTVVGNDQVYFQATPPDRVEQEMTDFLKWYNEG